MWRKATKATFGMTLLLSACETPGEQQEVDLYIIPHPPEYPFPQLPPGKATTAFAIESATEPGAFNAYLRNDTGLSDPALHARMRAQLRAFCDAEPVAISDVVIITADQRHTTPYIEYSFRCETLQ